MAEFKQNELRTVVPRTSQQNQTRALRLLVIRKFGGKCFKCGFSDYRALQIDHVEGGGKWDVRTSSYANMLRDALMDRDGEFQLLCANCNQIKRYETGEGCNETTNAFWLSAMEKDQILEISFC